MKKIILLALCLFPVLFINGQESAPMENSICKIVQMEQQKAKSFFPYNKAQRPELVDINYYKIDVFAVPDSIYISGNVTAYFTVSTDSTSKLVLDLAQNMIVDSVYFSGSKSAYAQIPSSDELEISFNKMLYQNMMDSVQVFYRGYPTQTGFGAFKVTSHLSGEVLWTLSEPYGAKEWWPNKQTLTDKADSIDVIVTTSLGNRVASNGLLVKIDTLPNNLHKFHWSSNYPIAAYLIAIAISNYEVFEQTAYFANDSLKLYYYLYPSDSLGLANSMNTTPEFMQLFDSLFGTYPFIKEKYGHASFGFGGGMEHQTMSFMGGYSGELIAHEMAHQWFGDAVTCASWGDVWLNEGFANYLTGLTYENNVVHDSAYWDVWRQNTLSAATSLPHGSVWVEDTTNTNQIFSYPLSYAKGAYLLHMLRWKVGDSAFFAGCRNYLHDPSLSYGFAETADLKNHLEASSGMNLTEFFDDWYYGKGYPSYSIQWSNTSTGMDITILQSQSDTSVSFFDIPLPILIKTTGFDTVIVLEPTQSPQSYSLPLNFSVTDVDFDPELNILSRNNIITSIHDIEQDQFVSFYPNPVHENLNIEVNIPSERARKIEIFNINGQKVKALPFSPSLSVVTLAPGLYFIEISTENKLIRRKFIKK